MPVVPFMIIPAQGSDQADEWHRLGFESQVAALQPGLEEPQRQSKLAEAQQRYQHALRLDPRHALATQNLAVVFAQAGHLNEGALTIERASMYDGTHWEIAVNQALVLFDLERIEEAIVAARRAISIKPVSSQARLCLAMMLTSAGKPDEALEQYNLILDAEPKHPMAGPNACFVGTLTDSTPVDLLKQRTRWWVANKFEGKRPRHDNEKTTDRPLHIGYVGGDFKCHSASFIFSHVLFNHDPAVVEMYLYCSLPVNPASDHATKRFQDLAGKRWRDISALDPDAAAALILKDRIDILVDLAGHTAGGRLDIFVRKPAPVQVTAWGFAHGTGCPEIDYFLADPVAVPEEERKYFAEKIWDIPCIVTMEEPTHYNLKGASQPPIRKNGVLTFGAYARYEKMSDDCIRTLAEVLRRVPDSRLEFKDNAYRRPDSIRRIMKLMPDIAPDRLLFSLATNHPDHMLAYQQADICLDPFPHGGGVVALEQLYMSVPLVTLYGKQPSGRSAASVLTVMGHGDWVAKSKEEYVEIAVHLAEQPKLIADLRKTLRQELLDSLVVKGYVQAVELAYRNMWAKHCEEAE